MMLIKNLTYEQYCQICYMEDETPISFAEWKEKQVLNRNYD